MVSEAIAGEMATVALAVGSEAVTRAEVGAQDAASECDWQARAAAWELLALSFRYPDLALAEAVATGEWFEAARELADALGLELPEGFGEGLPACVQGSAVPDAEAVEALRRALRVEATRLFVGAPVPACPPYEGIHRAQADGVQALLFVNPYSMDVERFMRSCGLGHPEGTNEPLDHIATECEFMQYLASLAAGIVEVDVARHEPAVVSADSGDEEGVEGTVPTGEVAVDAARVAAVGSSGGSAKAAYDRFRAEHLLAWAPSFAVRLESETREPFYRAAAQFLVALNKG